MVEPSKSNNMPENIDNKPMAYFQAVNELQRPFVCVHSMGMIEREIDMAMSLIEHDGTAFPDSTFEDGYIAALNFVLSRHGSNVREEYEDLMDELNGKAQC